MCDITTHTIAPKGLTLIELLVVIAVIAILAGAVGPNFYHMLTRSRLSAAVFELRADLNYARNEAIRRKQSVLLCKSDNGLQCNSKTSWVAGWIIFNDTDHDKQVDADEALLRHHGNLGDINVVNPYENYIEFHPNGQTSMGSISSFWFCNPLDNNKHKAIAIWRSGRARTYEGDSGGKC